jgi:hypothetical protein
MSALPHPHHNRRTIAVCFKSVLTLVFCALTCSWAQDALPARVSAESHAKSPRPVTLTKQDGLSIVSVARDSHLRRGAGNDCSHLVHTIYQRAGFSYPYADSSDLYRGTPYFLRVKHPQRRSGGLAGTRRHYHQSGAPHIFQRLKPRPWNGRV